MNPEKTQPTASSTDPVAAFSEAPTARGKYRARQKTGRGFQSSEPLSSNRLWTVRVIKRKKEIFRILRIQCHRRFSRVRSHVFTAATLTGGRWLMCTGTLSGEMAPRGRVQSGRGVRKSRGFSQQSASTAQLQR